MTAPTGEPAAVNRALETMAATCHLKIRSTDTEFPRLRCQLSFEARLSQSGPLAFLFHFSAIYAQSISTQEDMYDLVD